MFGISGTEVMIIALVALVVLGPDRLPIVARRVGQIVGDLRKVSAGFEAEMRTAMYEQDRPAQPTRPPSDVASSIEATGSPVDAGVDEATYHQPDSDHTDGRA